MSKDGLAARFAEIVAAADGGVPSPKLVHAADFVRLLTGTTVASADQFGARFAALCRAVEARTGLPAAEADILVRLAQAPRFRGRVDAHELESFVARFGAEAGQSLVEEIAQDVDLDEYPTRYGPGAALGLLDAMFAVASSDGALDPIELRRLESAASELGIDAVLFAALHGRHDPRAQGGEWTVPLEGARIRVGRSPGGEIVLPDPQVAPFHVELARAPDEGHDAGRWRVVDAESGRPTVLNGRAVSSAPMGDGDELSVGPYRLRLDLDGQRLHIRNERMYTALSARDLSRSIGDISLLDQLSFTVFAGEVVAMVGPSGAGKTTLLNAIAGVTPADSGTVSFDRQDFHALLQLDRSRVGIVPQDDIVHPELLVEESLFFSGRLRFSSDTSADEVHGEVDRVLTELGIDQIRDSRIGDALRRGISGGQRKRVNLGQELLTRSTRVLFLDEPTSGLDPRAAQDIVRVVRRLADRGRIVFLVTHDLSPQVMAQVDHLLVLAPGGRLAWFGPPADACRYFRVPTADAIFNRFAERSPSEWGAAYRASPAYETYVAMRERFLEMEAEAAPPPEPPVAVRRSGLHQLRTLVARYWRVKRRDTTGLFVLGAQPPFLAAVTWLVFPQPTPSMLFMLALSCMWFGMSASVRELIADRVVWNRERRVGVGVLPYVGSKVVVLGFLVALQCIALGSLDWLAFGLGGHGFGWARLCATSVVVGWTGMSLGLLMSALFLSSEAAVGTLPLLLIPQITFSSLLVTLRLVPPAAFALSWLNPLRYAFDALIKTGLTWDGASWRLARLFQPPRYGDDWAREEMKLNGVIYDLGLKDPKAPDADYGLLPWQLHLILFGFVFVFLSLATLRVRTRKAS